MQPAREIDLMLFEKRLQGRAFPLRNGIGVLPGGKRNHIRAHACGKHHFNPASRRVFARPVRIEDQYGALCVAAQQLHLLARQRRAARSDSVANARLMQRHDIRIALDEHRLFLLANDLPGLPKAVQYPPFVVYDGLRGINVFGLGAILLPGSLAERPAPEPQHLAHVRKHGKYDPVPVAIVISLAALFRDDQPGLLQRFGGYMVRLGLVKQMIPAIGRVAYAKLLDGGLRIPAAPNVFQRPAPRVGAGQLPVIEPGGETQRAVRRFHRVGPLPGRVALLRQLDARRFRQGAHGLGKRHPLHFLYKPKYVAPRPATEAFINAKGGIHAERRRFFLMKRAQSEIIGPSLLQTRISAHDIDDIRRRAHFRNRIIRKIGHSIRKVLKNRAVYADGLAWTVPIP